MIYCFTIVRVFIVMIALVSSMATSQEAPTTMHIQVQPSQVGTMKLLVAILKNASSDRELLANVAHVVQKDLMFTQQFVVDLNYVDDVPSKQAFKQMRDQGYELVVFVEHDAAQKAFNWRLYDTSGPVMIKGKRLVQKGSCSRGWAHALADAVWPELTCNPGFFSTKIAYSKDVKELHAKAIKHICVADYDGSHEQVVVDTHTLNIAPRWNVDQECPILFYSEHTTSNVRLMMASMDKKRRVVVNFDGLTMLPCFSSDGKRVAFCASRGDGYCDLYCFEQGGLKRWTQNAGNNIAPVFAHNDAELFFCSDRDGAPQIYQLHVASGQIERITTSGYCVSPAFCATTNTLAYAKMVQGIMQIFTYDLATKKHTQITFDTGNKEECSWSLCGNYLLFSQENKLKSRVAMINVHTNHKRFLTAETSSCSYPTWSPVYAQLPVVC